MGNPFAAELFHELTAGDSLDRELLIEAFKGLSAQMPNVRLIIAGGNHPQTPWAFPTLGKKTRHNKRTDHMIVERRK